MMKNPKLYLTIIVVLAIVLSLWEYTHRTERLYNRYFKPLPNMELARWDGGASSDLEKALYFYDMRDYDKAATIFGIVLKDEPDNETALMYGGISYMIEGNISLALDYFNKIGQKEGMFQQDARWFKTLVYLKKEELDSARTLCQEIAKEEGVYQERASELLRKLPS
ncbi:tetratricopeptide repeat protein [Limibacter armeniacum]|uniref:tetratricopeptide repeat protein n=1 Tax=Limibacter armeniacum TaxID=466084 RepID=UPI002FE6969D